MQSNDNNEGVKQHLDHFTIISREEQAASGGMYRRFRGRPAVRDQQMLVRKDLLK